MKKIIVFGATGGTGTQVVAKALEAGHTVTAVVRNPEALIIRHKSLDIVKGDVTESATFAHAIRDKDVVVSCLGTRKRKPTTIYSEGVGNIIKAMQKENVSRIICISAGAIIIPPNSSLLTKFVTKNVLQRLFKHMYADMLLMEKQLNKTTFNWTIIRAPWLRDTKLTGRYRIALNDHLQNPSKISRADLADYIVVHLNDTSTYKAMVEISY